MAEWRKLETQMLICQRFGIINFCLRLHFLSASYTNPCADIAAFTGKRQRRSYSFSIITRISYRFELMGYIFENSPRHLPVYFHTYPYEEVLHGNFAHPLLGVISSNMYLIDLK